MTSDHSENTVKRAIAFGTGAKKLGFKNEPTVMMNYDTHGDTMVYFLANESGMAVVYCCNNCYLVTLGSKDHMTKGEANYLMVKGLSSFLKNLKAEGYDFVSREEIKDLEERFKKAQRPPQNDDDE